MMHRISPPFLTLLTLLGLIAAACGSPQEATVELLDPTEPADVVVESPDSTDPADVVVESPDSTEPADVVVESSDSTEPADVVVESPDSTEPADVVVESPDSTEPADVAVSTAGAVDATVEPSDELVVSAECDRADFVGTWLSPRAAGTEPLEENDGVGDEGGSGVVSLRLRADEDSQLLSSDTIQIIADWSCIGSTIIAVDFQGEERELAQVNNDGTLQFGQWTLTKSEQ